MVGFNKLGKYGRLGNQFFQVAMLTAYAKRHGYDYAIPYDWSGSDFRTPAPFIDGLRLDREVEYDGQAYEKFEHHGDDISIAGFFQSELYFVDQIDSVMEHLLPNEGLKESLLSRMPQVVGATGMHIRRGDYVPMHESLPMSYYEKAMSTLGVNKSQCVIFSDDIEWCRSNFGDGFTYATGFRPVEDIFLLSLCENHIIANSSFSWWGAYLRQGGTTICPSHPFRNWNPKWFVEYYPERWIKI